MSISVPFDRLPSHSGKTKSLLCLKGSVTPISEQQLQAITNDVSDISRNQSVVFVVTAPPKLGRLLRRMPDNSTENISTFTQSMVGVCASVCVAVEFCSRSKTFVPLCLFVSAS